MALKVQHLNDSALRRVKGREALFDKFFALSASLNEFWLDQERVVVVLICADMLVIKLTFGKVSPPL